ncbi:MAG: PASTA domain-containing protein [Actinomycetota bacterium]|nr:PASTA domain-containing protein [Actinomycetota bacterium]
MSSPLRQLLIAVIAALAFPGTAGAAVSTFGSDLSAPANSIEPEGAIHPFYKGVWNGADTAFWNTKLASGAPVTAPADGQIVEIRVKGTALAGPHPWNPSVPPRALVHFQVLHPQGDGSLKVDLTSGGVDWPIGGDSQQITTFRPVNLCTHKGDYVDFNTWGGHEWRWEQYGGIPMQVFSQVRGSSFNWYEKDNGTNNGQYLYGRLRDGRELLMQTVIATGPDATDMCPGGYAQHIYRGLEVQPSPQSAVLRTRDRVAKVRTFCHGENYGACIGTMKLTADIDGQEVVLGSTDFKVDNSYTVNVQVPLSPEVVYGIQVAKSLRAKVTVDSHDDPRSDERVKWGEAIPVQSKVTTGEITIKPDKLLPVCTVPHVKGLRLAKAKSALKKAACPVGRVRYARGSKRGRVINQKPNRGKPLNAGTKVYLTVAR